MKLRLLSLVLLISTVSLSSCQPKGNKTGSGITYNIGGEPTTLSPLSASDGYTTNVHSMFLKVYLVEILILSIGNPLSQ